MWGNAGEYRLDGWANGTWYHKDNEVLESSGQDSQGGNMEILVGAGKQTCKSKILHCRPSVKKRSFIKTSKAKKKHESLHIHEHT